MPQNAKTRLTSPTFENRGAAVLAAVVNNDHFLFRVWVRPESHSPQQLVQRGLFVKNRDDHRKQWLHCLRSCPVGFDRSFGRNPKFLANSLLGQPLRRWASARLVRSVGSFRNEAVVRNHRRKETALQQDEPIPNYRGSRGLLRYPYPRTPCCQNAECRRNHP